MLAALGRVDAVWHLGDVVGYGPHPDEVVARLRELGAVGVRATTTGPPSTSRWPTGSTRMHVARSSGQPRRIAPATRAWLAELPERREMDGVTLVHGSPRDPTWEYITTAAGATANLGAFATAHLLFGHTHLPIAYRDDGGRMRTLEPTDGSSLTLDARRTLANPGSVGQPRDGDPRACAMVLDTAASTLTWRRVAYPIATTQADIRAVGLPGWLAIAWWAASSVIGCRRRSAVGRSATGGPSRAWLVPEYLGNRRWDRVLYNQAGSSPQVGAALAGREPPSSLTFRAGIAPSEPSPGRTLRRRSREPNG